MEYNTYISKNKGVIKYISKGSDIEFDNEEESYEYYHSRWEYKKNTMNKKEREEYEWEMNLIRWME